MKALAHFSASSPSFTVLAALAVLLGVRLHDAITRSLFESRVQASLRQSFEDIPGFYLASVRFGAQKRAGYGHGAGAGPNSDDRRKGRRCGTPTAASASRGGARTCVCVSCKLSL